MVLTGCFPTVKKMCISFTPHLICTKHTSSPPGQWSHGHVRLQPQLVNGHSLPRAHHRVIELLTFGQEGAGEGTNPGEGHQGGLERAGGSNKVEVAAADAEAGDKDAGGECVRALDK